MIILESYFIKGLIIGLIFGVPAGAIGALTIQRTLSYGFLAGFLTGTGSSVADVGYACVGVFGLTVISDFLLANQTIISLFGGAVVFLTGAMIFKQKKDLIHLDPSTGRLLSCFRSSFAIAIANPATILTFLLAFTSFGIVDDGNPNQKILLVSGIFFGTCFWWTLLAGGVSAFRSRITEGIYMKLNRFLGGFMMLFGVGIFTRGCL